MAAGFSGRVIAFVPASGGVGASTLGCAVAVRAAAAGRSACVVDLDAVSGRLDVVCGIEQEPGWRWPRLAGVDGVVDGAALSQRLPCATGVPVLTGPPRGPSGTHRGGRRAGEPGPARRWVELVPDVVAGLAEAHEVVVLDVPRDAGVVARVAAHVDVWVVVVGTHVPQLGAAARTVPWLRTRLATVPGQADAPRHDTPWVVLRGQHVDDDVSDAVTDHLDVPVVTLCADDPRVVADVTSGAPPGARGRGPVVEAADTILLRLLSLPHEHLGDVLAGQAGSDESDRHLERWAS